MFPRPRLNSIAPDDATSIMDLQIACHPDIVPISVKMMISKGCPVISDYTPQRGAVPLYEFCELQTLLLREVDDMSLKELQFRTPQGPLAKKHGALHSEDPKLLQAGQEKDERVSPRPHLLHLHHAHASVV